MRNLIAFIQRFNHWLLFLLLESISLILLFTYNGYQGSVWFSSAGTISGSLFSLQSWFANFFDQTEINNELTSANIDLQLENQRLRDVIEKSKIKADDKYDDQINYRYVPAKVVCNTLNERDNLITINRGYADGITEDMGVVNGQGVVGIVYLVDKNYSVVLSVLNTHSNISCIIKNRGYFGYLVWEGGDPDVAFVNDIPRHAHFQIGDDIITSGYSSVFPKGIHIGKIIASYNSEDGLSYKLKIKLSTNFTHLRDVRVVDNSSLKEKIRIQQLAKDSLLSI